jgi:hypothetical protein
MSQASESCREQHDASRQEHERCKCARTLSSRRSRRRATAERRARATRSRLPAPQSVARATRCARFTRLGAARFFGQVVTAISLRSSAPAQSAVQHRGVRRRVVCIINVLRVGILRTARAACSGRHRRPAIRFAPKRSGNESHAAPPRDSPPVPPPHSRMRMAAPGVMRERTAT